ncbi:MAG TPA: amidase family protein [Candidatus Binatia bacterium]|nr:amidase family protein [Candidatus Binatia bacterium]
MAFAQYAEFDGLGLAELVHKGEVSPTELVEEAIARIEKHNPKLNAVVHKFYERGRAAAATLAQRRDQRRPFHGVPFLLKDILGNYQGEPTASGCRFMTGVVAPHDDTLVARYKAAGLVPLAKTNAPECGILPTTEPALYGSCHNPWNLDHSTGGSSGGSAAAVAAGIVPLAHANDGGGSIRIPASCCGLVGLKPTRARNPLGPDLGDMMSGLVVEHVVSRTVRDCAAALDCTHGPEPGDPYYAPAVERPFIEAIRTPPTKLRIAYWTKSPTGARLHPDCVAAIELTAKLCADAGHIVEEGAPPLDMGVFMPSFLTVFTAATPTMIDGFAMLHGRTPTERDFEPLTWGIYQMGKQISAVQYQIAIAMIQMAAREIARWHQTYDCWLTTTLGTPPITLGLIDINQSDPMVGMGPLADYVPFTPIQNATGQPAISLPLHWNAAGLPIGVMFTGRFGDEATLLRLAAQLEQARPWKDRRPPIYG